MQRVLKKIAGSIREDWIIWGMPTLLVPALRFLNDPPETRRKLYIRDFSSYATGMAIYFLVKKTDTNPIGP